MIVDIQQLSTSEKILLVEKLWGSVRADAINNEITDAQAQELDNRLATYELDRDAGDRWDAVKNRIISP